MTFIVETAKGPIKIVTPTSLTSSLRRKIRKSLTAALDNADWQPATKLQNLIKKRIPWVDKPRGAFVAYMSAQGWTQQRLSKRTGIPQGNISAMFNGRRPIGLATAKKIAKAFGVDYRRFV